MISSQIIQAISKAKSYPYIVRVGVFGSHVDVRWIYNSEN